MKIRVIAALLACVLGQGCARMASLSVLQAAPELSEPTVRVLLGKDYDSVVVSSSRSYRLDVTLAGGDTVTYYSLTPMVIRRNGAGLKLVDRGTYVLEKHVKHVRAVPQTRGSQVRVNGFPYRGEIGIRAEGEHKVAAVNRLGMEPYLFGVVPGEIGFFTPDLVEAIEAQAVAARTYAFSHRGQYGGKDYDLVSDVMDQVYGGVKKERPIVTAAVWATRGEVMRYDGEFVKAYYHSTCGGRTEAIGAVWSKPPEPYLVGADDDDWCSWSSYWNWEEVCTRKWLDSTVAVFVAGEKKGGKPLGKLEDLRVVRRRDTGRVDVLKIVFEKGTIEVAGDRSRWVFGRPSKNTPILPSANYKLNFDVKGGKWSKITVVGKGYGHGVGMCQCGAIGRARGGQKHDEILRAYYTGASLDREY